MPDEDSYRDPRIPAPGGKRQDLTPRPCWFTLGQASDGKLLAVAHTYSTTGPNTAKVRVISAREATKAERRQYENEPR